MSMSTAHIQCRNPTCHRLFDSHAAMLQHYTDFRHTTTISDQHHQDPPATQSGGHAEDGFHACDLCPRYFKSKTGLEDHLRASHLTTYQDVPQYPLAPPLLQDQGITIEDVACNDCGRTFKTTDSLHQHQWDVPDHTCVVALRDPNYGTRVRRCSQCDTKLPTAEDLDQHFVDQHPVSEVPESHHDLGTWQLIEGRFQLAWTKPTIQLYKVHRIFKVYNPGWRRKDFEDYRKELKREMSDPKMIKEDIPNELRNKIRSNGNELHRYHGTTVKCSLGRPAKLADGTMDMESLSLCTNEECSLCRILQTGFMRDKCRVTRFQRYGKGIYCSSSSSKASAYAKCSTSAGSMEKKASFWCFSICFDGDDDSSDEEERYKLMIACRVLAGRPYHTTQNLQHLKGPPVRFHSVQGNPGEKLNYDELVVYDDRAILPSYIILYTSSDD